MGEVVVIIIFLFLGLLLKEIFEMYAIPIIIGLAIIIAIGIFCKRSVRKRVRNGRLTKEIISSLEEEEAKKNLSEFKIEPNSVAAYFSSGRLRNKWKNYNLTNKLTTNEMDCLCEEISLWLGKDFEKQYHRPIKSGRVNIPVGKIDSDTVYKTDYIDAQEEYWTIKRKVVVVHHPRKSNW